MENKYINFGNHKINDDTDGYIYSFNTTKSYNFNSHIHKCYEFIHVIHGQLLYTVEGSDYILCDGDFVMTTPDELHSFSFPKECDYQREFLHIYPNFLKDYPKLIETLNSRKLGNFNRIPADLVKKHGIDMIFNSIEKYCENPVPETDFMILTYSLQLITKINQILRTESPTQQVISNTKTNLICSYIDKNYNNNITVDSIANAMFISPSYASRMFKKETGMTIKSYLNLRRVTCAKKLIMEGQKSTNIFDMCGFYDYSTFYRAFVKYVGMTPYDFKYQHNKN